MFTLHNNHYIALIFCLLPNKQLEMYTQTEKVQKSFEKNLKIYLIQYM